MVPYSAQGSASHFAARSLGRNGRLKWSRSAHLLLLLRQPVVRFFPGDGQVLFENHFQAVSTPQSPRSPRPHFPLDERRDFFLFVLFCPDTSGGSSGSVAAKHPQNPATNGLPNRVSVMAGLCYGSCLGSTRGLFTQPVPTVPCRANWISPAQCASQFFSVRHLRQGDSKGLENCT